MTYLAKKGHHSRSKLPDRLTRCYLVEGRLLAGVVALLLPLDITLSFRTFAQTELPFVTLNAIQALPARYLAHVSIEEGAPVGVHSYMHLFLR